jgi:hypothetical protein
MWTSRNRARYDRSKLRYPSDVTDEEWELIVPLIPPGKSGGGKRVCRQFFSNERLRARLCRSHALRFRIFCANASR